MIREDAPARHVAAVEETRTMKLVLRFAGVALAIHGTVLLLTAAALAILGIPLSAIPIELSIASLSVSAMLTALLLARQVVKTIADLRTAAERIAQGEDVPRLERRAKSEEFGALFGSFEDMVHSLQAAQDELRNARTYVVRVIESMPEAVIVTERDEVVHLRICNVNRAGAELLGYAREQLVGQPLDVVLRDPGGARGLMLRMEEKDQLRGHDTRLARFDGVVREVRLSASRVAGTGPAELSHSVYVLVVSDVAESRGNERRRIATYRLSELVQDAETPLELLRGVESVLRAAMHVDAFHVAIVDEHSEKATIAHFSDPRWPEPPAHELTKGLTGYVLAAEAAVTMSASQIRALVERGEVRTAEPLAEHWASAPIPLGATTNGVLVVQTFDVTQPFQSADIDLLLFAAEQVAAFYRRRRAEEERTRLSAAVAHAVDAVLIFDDATRLAYANPAFERQTSFDRAEVFGRTLEELWVPNDEALPMESVMSAVRSGNPWTGRAECRRKDGSNYRVEATLSAVRDRDGRVVEYVVVQHDISNEIALEDQLRQAQKMEAIGMLAGGVAHDFNNMLSVIQGYGEMVRSRITEQETTGWIDEVLRASERAMDLVGQLLAFSRRTVIEPRPLELVTVVLGIEGMLRRVIGEDVRLTVTLPRECDLVEADPGQIEQVLMNLVVNARDAMPSGGALTLGVENLHLDADAVRLLPELEPGPHVVLYVTDTGMGMSPEVQKRIFEPFFTTKPQGKGTGLGLSTVYGVVKQAGGHIEVKSQLGKGTEFRIYLPSIGRAFQTQELTQELTGTLDGEETILVVEDEDALRVFVHRILTRQGYTVFVAESGMAALEISRGHSSPIDLLLTDVVMENMNGSSLAKTIAAERPDTAVLYMSGYPDASIASYGVLDPDVDLLQKPFTSGRLLKRVRRALDGRRRKRRQSSIAERR